MSSSVSTELSAIKNALEENQLEKSVRLVKELADKGHRPAANLYGDMLMAGVWDNERMSRDLACDKLEPATEDPLQDPYLILSRNPLKAVEYYRIASKEEGKSASKTSRAARAKLAYLKMKGYLGLEKAASKRPINLEEKDMDFLDQNAKSNKVSDVESNKFVPLADVRPPVSNLKTRSFQRIGSIASDRCIYQAIALQMVIVFATIFLGLGKLTFPFMKIGLFAFVLPLLICSLVSHIYGFKNKSPMCTCKNIQKAYAENLKDVPDEFKKEDPFKSTNWFVKNAQKIKASVFYLSIILSISSLICFKFFYDFHVKIFGDKTSSYFVWLVLLDFLIPAYVIVLWDKLIFESLHRISGSARFFFSTILVFIFAFPFDDYDCDRELRKAKQRTGFERAIECL